MKLYNVNLILESCVFANSEEEAKQIALDSANTRDFICDVTLIDDEKQIPLDWKESVPLNSIGLEKDCIDLVKAAS